MDETQKQIVLHQARSHVVRVSQRILETKTRIDNSIIQLKKELIKARGEERDTKEILLYHHLDTQRNMAQQHAAPYFVRCDVTFDDEVEQRTFYFGRFPYTAESIYSWVAPFSIIRFETPGTFSYETPKGDKRTGTLLRKDQFMIVNGKIIFMSNESITLPRELIYQEYFSQKKSEFVLKEIVEQMEKAQDTIIRSHYFGSFLISGPAGSGKTTLALHRAAYLIQSPDTAELFPSKKVIVFVHDAITKNYFSNLLPQLGIHNVTITTFYEWATKILGLYEMKYVHRYGRTEKEKDAYEYAKNLTLKMGKTIKIGKDVHKTLGEMYKGSFSEDQTILFSQQSGKKILDRFDVTILLKLSMAENGQLFETVEKYVKQMNGRYVKKTLQQPVQYALIVLDEAENYLAEQIAVIKSSVETKTNGIIYVGDLVQRTLPFTISGWQEVDEEFSPERRIVLQKVYRNTKQILTFIQSLGYSVIIPENIKGGKPVESLVIEKKADEIQQIISRIKNKKDVVIGVLAKSEEYLQDFKKQLSPYANVQVLTINESQGVEFDTVFVVGIDQKTFGLDGLPDYLRAERQRVDRDLLYVALTRAMNELYVLGKKNLKEILQHSASGGCGVPHSKKLA